MNTSIDTIAIPVRLGAAISRSSAVFDTLERQRRWRPPVTFVTILTASVIVCFVVGSRTDQTVLLGSVLTTIALELPAVYFGMFLYSLDSQARTMELNAARLVYTVELNGRDNDTHVTSAPDEGQTAQFH